MASRKTERVFTICWYLEKSWLSAAQLSSICEIADRTIFRDLKDLRELGIIVKSDNLYHVEESWTPAGENQNCDIDSLIAATNDARYEVKQMSDKIEKTVMDYGNIMALCLTEASRMTSRASIHDIELRRQIAHDLFMAVTGDSMRSAELEALDKLREVAQSFKQSDDQIPLEGLIMTPRGPILVGRASYGEEESESGEDPVLPKPPKRNGE